jgi:hemerythrin-like domain-containing protein
MSGLKHYPVVESVIDLFARWLQRRREIAEICSCGADEYAQIARDLGVSSGELSELVQRGPHAADELSKMMATLGLDAQAIARVEPLVIRDLQRVCALCEQKKQCDRDLTAGTAVQHYKDYCANAPTLAALGSELPVRAGIREGPEPVVIDVLRQEHRNIEKLLCVLERELSIFARAERPDYEVIRAAIAYFQVYPDVYHHPQEDAVFEKLKARDSVAAANIGDLAADHKSGAERLRRVAQAVDSVLADQEVLRQAVVDIIRDFIEHERRHIAMEERDFFPAAVKALQPEDWAEIVSRLTDQKDPLFSEIVEERFEAVRTHIVQLEQEAEAERSGAHLM